MIWWIDSTFLIIYYCMTSYLTYSDFIQKLITMTNANFFNILVCKL